MVLVLLAKHCLKRKMKKASITASHSVFGSPTWLEPLIEILPGVGVRFWVGCRLSQLTKAAIRVAYCSNAVTCATRSFN